MHDVPYPVLSGNPPSESRFLQLCCYMRRQRRDFHFTILFHVWYSTMLLTSILLYLPLLAAAADGLVLVGLTRRSHFPPAALVKRQEANATGIDASEPSSNSTTPPPGIIPNGNSTGGNETIGNPQGSSNGPVSNDTGSRATTVGHEALTGLLGTTYLAMNVSVGTPGQDVLVAVALDEAGDLRLVGCNGTTCPQAQGGGKVFDSSKSTSFKTENRTGGDGMIAADTVTVGGVSVVDQPFSESTLGVSRRLDAWLLPDLPHLLASPASVSASGVWWSEGAITRQAKC